MIHLRNEFILAPIKLGYSDHTGKIKQKTPVYYVGDALKVGNAQDAIHKAYEVASGL